MCLGAGLTVIGSYRAACVLDAAPRFLRGCYIAALLLRVFLPSAGRVFDPTIVLGFSCRGQGLRRKWCCKCIVCMCLALLWACSFQYLGWKGGGRGQCRFLFFVFRMRVVTNML